jgi:hypothetical protein
MFSLSVIRVHRVHRVIRVIRVISTVAERAKQLITALQTCSFAVPGSALGLITPMVALPKKLPVRPSNAI